LLYARRKGWAVDGVEVDVRHASGRGQPKDRIELVLSFGGDLTGEQVARLRAVSRRCPVHRMLGEGVEITEG
jgi:putative redox protein